MLAVSSQLVSRMMCVQSQYNRLILNTDLPQELYLCNVSEVLRFYTNNFLVKCFIDSSSQPTRTVTNSSEQDKKMGIFFTFSLYKHY